MSVQEEPWWWLHECDCRPGYPCDKHEYDEDRGTDR